MKKSLAWPLLLSAALFLIYIAFRLLGSPEDEKALQYLLLACLFCLSVMLVRALNVILLDVVFKHYTGRPAPSLLHVLVSVFAYAGLLPLIYSIVFHRSLTMEVLTTSAALTVVIGLALQDTLGNFFAGLSLQIEQPFRIGDVIRLRNVFGQVEAFTWRSISIRTNDNTLITFPNSVVAREMVELLPYNHLNRRVLPFPVPYSIPPETVLPLVRDAVATVPNVAAERTPVVRINGFTESHITYEVLYWVKDYMFAVDMDARMRERIWYAFHRHGMQPLPVRRIHYERHEPMQPRPPLNYQEIISQVDIFAPLNATEQTELVKTPVAYVYAPGERILRSGTPGDSMFVVCRGTVEVRSVNQDGSSLQVATMTAGDYFGEMALFTGEPRKADIYALEESEVLEIRKASLEPLFHQNEQLAEAFSQVIAERQANLSASLQRTHDDENALPQETILARIKHFFGLGVANGQRTAGATR